MLARFGLPRDRACHRRAEGKVIESALTLLGSAGIATLAARFFAHRESIKRIDAADMAARRREAREETQRTVLAAEAREAKCAERCDRLEGELDDVRTVAHEAALALARCEERHDAMEERMQ